MQFVGDVGPVVSLQAARREAWERTSKILDERVAARAAAKADMADTSEWGRIAEESRAIVGAVEKMDSAAAHAAASRVLALTSPAPRSIGKYEDRPRLGGVHVSFRLLSRAEMSRLTAPLVRIERAMSKIGADAIDEYLEANADAASAQLAFIRRAVASIDHARAGWSYAGDALSDEALAAIERHKITVDLFACAREAQDLDPFELATFGGSPQPISQTSYAPSVHALHSGSKDASTTAPSAIVAPSTNPAPAQGGSSYATRTLPGTSSFTDAPTAG